MTPASSGDPPKPPLKRALFSKPTWAKTNVTGNSTDFFRRSNQSYLDIAAEAERKRQKKLVKKQREEACTKDTSEPLEKRRRFSDESSTEGGSSLSNSEKEVRNLGKRRSTSPREQTKTKHVEQSQQPVLPENSPKSLQQQYERAQFSVDKPSNPETLPSNVIDLEEEDEEEGGRPNPQVDFPNKTIGVHTIKPSLEEEESPVSDDEFAELARKAREKARRKRLQDDMLGPDRDLADQPKRAPSVFGSGSSSASPDPVVSILITSRVSNTSPLIVQRRTSQRLKDVRLTWCQRQGMSQDTTETIFLTWRGRRLFDVTTCKSLGIGIDANGNVMMNGHREILGDDERHVHMEAMTEEILEEYKKSRRREADTEGEPNAAARDEQPPAKKIETQIRIIVKAKGYEDFKLIVKPVTLSIFLSI